MTNTVDPFDNIVLNETVYIYKKPDARFYSKNYVNNLFRAVKDEKREYNVRPLFSFVNQDNVSFNGKQYRISGIVLKYQTGATFTKEYIAGWDEIKLAYLFLVDFQGYLFIAKRNIAGLSQFTDLLEPLPYEVISKMLYNANSLLESYGMDNMDSSSSAMKSRKVAAENLKDSFNYVGANTYVLNFLRIHNDKDRYAISVNTSKLSRSGEKSQLLRLADSCAVLAVAAENYAPRETPLDVFAKPYNYAVEKDHLNPTSVTILFTRLLEDMDNGIITEFRYEHNFRRRTVDIRGFITGLSQYIELELSDDPEIWEATANTPQIYEDVTVKKNPKSIAVNSKRLRNLKVFGPDGLISSVVEYINYRSNFFVAFEECEFRYNNHSLFKDSALLGSIPQFLDYFIPDAAANTIQTEKGIFTQKSTHFTTDSAFAFTEAKFQNADYLLLDDLGEEWADHIAIDGKNIIFVHAKAGDAVFSATAFTEIIGQAQKNIGALHATEPMIRRKTNIWQRNYRAPGVSTQISRLRRGNSVPDFIDRFISLTKDVNSKKQLCLNLNFISKALLDTNLNHLRNNTDFPQKKEAIQILWQISSLIASCYEHNVGLQIWCKP
jgi:hypothetical protein